MKITKVICSKGRTGFFFDDQRAIKKGAVADGAAYVGQPVTDGFTSIRQQKQFPSATAHRGYHGGSAAVHRWRLQPGGLLLHRG